MQKFNYHTHTYRCGHADMNLSDENYIEEFMKQGFEKIAFTDHCPEKKEIDKRIHMRMRYSQKDEYLDSINKLKKKYAGKLDIQTGFEIEYLPGEEENLIELKKDTDKLILGQHFIYDDEKNLKIFRIHDFSDDELIRYGEYISEAMNRKIPDIIAHPDLYMLNREKFGETEAAVANIICKKAEECEIPLEINMADTFQYLIGHKNKVSYPCRGFWEVASKYNVKVIYGIDAHYREQITQWKSTRDEVNKIIGKETIKKLNLCDEI